MDYQSAFKKPFLDIKKLVIGILLSIIPIVSFFSVGYVLEVAKSTIQKKKDLPEWTNWKELFVHGLIGTVIGIIYVMPAIIIGLLAIGGGLLKGLVTNSVLSGIKTGAPLLIAAILLLLVSSYIAPMAIIAYAKSWKFKDAFNFSDIFKKIMTSKYLIVWILSMVVSVVALGIFAVIPLVGSAIASFTTAVIFMTLFAQVYTEVK